MWSGGEGADVQLRRRRLGSCCGCGRYDTFLLLSYARCSLLPANRVSRTYPTFWCAAEMGESWRWWRCGKKQFGNLRWTGTRNHTDEVAEQRRGPSERPQHDPFRYKSQNNTQLEHSQITVQAAQDNTGGERLQIQLPGTERPQSTMSVGTLYVPPKSDDTTTLQREMRQTRRHRHTDTEEKGNRN